MSEEPLTAEEVEKLQRIVDGDDGVRPIMFPWINRALAELRDRRARDLTSEDREALGYLRRFVDRMLEIGVLERETRALGALAALAKILAGGGR